MRARSLKPGIFKNEILGQADPILTLLFEGLWCLADRLGRLEDRPLRIKAEIFPYRELPDFNRYLTELAWLGFIQRYEAKGQALIYIPTFLKHQSPHKTERPSVLPGIADGCLVPVNPPLDNDGNPPDSLVLTPSSLTPDSPPNPLKGERPPSAPSVPLLKVKKEKPPKKIKTTALKPECVAVFQTTWDSPPKTVRKVDKELNDWVNEPVAKGSRMQAERNFQGIVDSGVATADELCYAFQAYCLEGIGPKKGFFQHVSTFFGPEKATYLEWLERARQIALEFA